MKKFIKIKEQQQQTTTSVPIQVKSFHMYGPGVDTIKSAVSSITKQVKKLKKK